MRISTLLLAIVVPVGALGVPHRVEAQVPLVLEVPEERAAEARALVSEVTWPFGPVRLADPAVDAEPTSAIVVSVVWPPDASLESVADAVERRATVLLAHRVDGGTVPRPDPPGPVHRLRGLNVTAAREAREIFSTPVPITVLGGPARDADLLAAPTDLFRDVAGLDVEGVAGQQRRPVIRGLRGQRVLLLADGLRMNNPRRRVDSGEPLDMVGPGEIERIEVVRGPASVLYGSDAIGGVVNLVTRTGPGDLESDDLGGSLRLGWSSAGDGRWTSGSVAGRHGPIEARLAGGYRERASYAAPGGEFGEVSLRDPVRVSDTGATDYGASVSLTYRPSVEHEIFTRLRRSLARDAGFGYVDPSLFGDGLPTIRILFPRQSFGRQVVGYRGSELRGPLADRLEVVAYRQTNDRTFVTDAHIPLGSPLPPGSFTHREVRSLTDLTSHGLRAEARKLVAERMVLTYGVDVHRDRSESADTSTTTVAIGGGTPRVTGSSEAQVPAARMRSLGLFAQARAALGSRAEATVGVRYQDVRARSLETGPRETDVDRTMVAAGHLLVRPTRHLGLILSVGRGFRSPNLVERYYTGPTPDGLGTWVRNRDLEAETSLNVDIGLRYAGTRWTGELFVFRNAIEKGIRLEATADTANGGPVYRNTNVEELRIQGVEATASADIGWGLTAMGGYTRISGRNRTSPGETVTESYGTKLSGSVRYDDPAARWHVEYRLRHQGSRDDVILDGGFVGATIPGFTTHGIEAHLSLPAGQRLSLSLENFTDRLYAESLNVGFFRPEPGRHLQVGWSWSF